MPKKLQPKPDSIPVYDPDFEMFYLELKDAIPALAVPGDLQMPISGFKKAMHTAYERGQTDFLKKLND